MKTKKIISGIAILILGFAILLGLTYVFDFMQGQKARELIIVVLGIIVFAATIYGAISTVFTPKEKDHEK